MYSKDPGKFPIKKITKVLSRGQSFIVDYEPVTKKKLTKKQKEDESGDIALVEAMHLYFPEIKKNNKASYKYFKEMEGNNDVS